MAFFVSAYRIIHFALQSFWRNIWLSIITVTILVLTLLIVNVLLVMNVLGQTAVTAVESKIDVSVSFAPETNEEVIAGARGYLMSLPQVKDARQLTPDEVLADFRDKNANKPEVLASLDEVGGNPFGAQLIVSAYDPADFPFILEALENPEYKQYIQDKDYQSHESIISAINHTIERVRIGGIILGAFFIFITILIVFNTIRVAIYTHREEIGIMRLVGASAAFVRGPFLVEAIIYTFVALGLIIAIVYPILGVVDPWLAKFFVSTPPNLLGYFNHNFLMIFGAEFVGLTMVTLLSTAYAMRRYLRI
ncbi:MAG: permease-like cell division protein FtsX [Patescibacteria group bacterium]